ncbi:hypothetical protein EV142_101596 [Flavobacterium circumlabens]|uniref:Uncharacterized protein n=1 Tax=Flavobacterium circumlabens TaxID=2133765 RepID=A0ABY2B6M2_9FLAO|nr:hypothetical protein EV142_101596 [Flavobacterium circumlabens]
MVHIIITNVKIDRSYIIIAATVFMFRMTSVITRIEE